MNGLFDLWILKLWFYYLHLHNLKLVLLQCAENRSSFSNFGLLVCVCFFKVNIVSFML